MKAKRPKTRTASTAPAATAHLNTREQRALEISGEVEHAIGQRREALTRAAKRLGESKRK